MRYDTVVHGIRPKRGEERDAIHSGEMEPGVRRQEWHGERGRPNTRRISDNLGQVVVVVRATEWGW